nr:MAG TPA: Prokaryotic diacylglycerol kinase [Caudoviricetes sp.]
MKITVKESIDNFESLNTAIKKLYNSIDLNLNGLYRRSKDWGSLSLEEAKDETNQYLDKLIRRLEALKQSLD